LADIQYSESVVALSLWKKNQVFLRHDVGNVSRQKICLMNSNSSVQAEQPLSFVPVDDFNYPEELTLLPSYQENIAPRSFTEPKEFSKSGGAWLNFLQPAEVANNVIAVDFGNCAIAPEAA